MNSDFEPPFAPRTIALARSTRSQRVGATLRIAVLRVGRVIRSLRARMSLSSQYQRELEMLIHADARILADIGLTRYDVVTAAQESRGWHGRRDALRAAASRREEAVAGARLRRSALPHTEAPPLVPSAPHAVETSNFR